jgi:hypothetical protein
MPPANEAGPALLPTASRPGYLFSLQEHSLLITICAFTQALVADPAFVVIAAAALIAWGLI